MLVLALAPIASVFSDRIAFFGASLFEEKSLFRFYFLEKKDEYYALKHSRREKKIEIEARIGPKVL